MSRQKPSFFVFANLACGEDHVLKRTPSASEALLVLFNFYELQFAVDKALFTFRPF
jgi:hypothetical protein